MDRLRLVLVGALVMLLPMIALAGGDSFSVGKATKSGDNTVVVPLMVENAVKVAAMDIPLRFSEGVTLKEVDFTDTRVSYFDLKIASIDNDNRTVVMGLFPQFASDDKPDLEPGSGVIAKLVFEVNDNAVSEIALEAVQLARPDHSLSFMYATNGANGLTIYSEEPKFTDLTISLSGVGGLPTSYSLAQNYPNPFNPSTSFAFEIPEFAHVRLSVYNLLGQHVALLIDRDMEPGRHEVQWEGSQYSSGVYFYTLSTDKYTETRKMLLLK